MSYEKPWETVAGDKQRCRNLFFDTVDRVFADRLATVPQGHLQFLLLPSREKLDWLAARSRYSNMTTVAIERDKIIATELEHFIGKSNIRRMAFDTYAEKSGETFDAAFIDYTGTFSETNVNAVSDFVANHTHGRFVLAVTFLRAPRGVKDEMTAMIMRHSPYEFADQRFMSKSSDITAPHAAAVLANIIHTRNMASEEQSWVTSTDISATELAILDSLLGTKTVKKESGIDIDIKVVDAFPYKSYETSTEMLFMVFEGSRN